MKRLTILAAALLLAGAGAAQAAIPVYGFIVKNSYPHDPDAFTQGLFYSDGVLYESTGLNGKSSVRKTDLKTGKVLMKTDIAADYFAEGITDVGNTIVGLTWTSRVGFVFDKATLKMKQTFSYPGEGWGLASNGSDVFMSDGTAVIRVLNPGTLAEVRRIQVTAEGKPIDRLNEMEWIDGELYANVWGSDVIARIDPASGKVVGWIDLAGLLDEKSRAGATVDVLNGIAYDSKKKRLFVTGKLWPRLFEIELVRRQAR
ncbi:glutaminyl-peptide cyclotransferase [Massilia atriviolacea]|uniref:Glutaminyl-peptide cyclotransferase n=1 Tax=Massilia atriviolacea TaxID=2495579 RepID=A0A430HTG6_9BURK|nr:glutaminyl-peptide cyclotransferase [Massilia atriviolacea]RSZ60826.1 glutaminyl-peptide cyclotransferase [Massilia atriviolacea]